MPPIMRPALAASVLALSVALLAGCGENQTRPSSDASGTLALSQEPIDAVPIQPDAPLPVAVEAPKTKVEPKATEASATDPAPASCLSEVGEAAANRLVARCIQVSPATHPPCNTANTCATIQSEITRSCAMYGPDETKPKDCTA